jgi:hypothetical protein
MQVAREAQQLADYYRGQLNSTSRSGQRLSATDIERLEQAQELASIAASRSRVSTSSSSAEQDINLTQTEIHEKVSLLMRAGLADLLERGIPSSLGSSGMNADPMAQTWEMADHELAKWDELAKDAEGVSKILQGTATPQEALQTTADAFKLTGAPLVGIDGVVGMQSGMFAMADHAFNSGGPSLFATTPNSTLGSYGPSDMSADLQNVAWQGIKSTWGPEFEAMEVAGNLWDAASQRAKSGLNAFNKFLYY